jgi:choloylglycine hydrolase
VRAVAFSQTVTQAHDEAQARDAAFHILNLFDIPQGVVCGLAQDGQVHCDYTQWTSAVDLRNRRYYFHTYGDRQVRGVDVMALDCNAKEPKVVMRMEGQ